MEYVPDGSRNKGEAVCRQPRREVHLEEAAT